MVRVFRKRSLMIIFFLILFSLSLFWNPLDAGKCEDALFRCTVTALIISVTDVAGGIAWGSFCLIGYSWCLEFMG